MSLEKARDWLDTFRSADGTLSSEPFVTPNKNATCISIMSGKGGVGKTTIAVKFAKTLADLGHKVLLLDLDYNLSNTSIKLDIPLNNNFYALLSSHKRFDECLYKDGNFHLLTGCNGELSLIDSKFEIDRVIIDIIASHSHEYDYIFVDSPAGLSEKILAINAYSDHRIVVLNPDKSSLTDAYSLIKVLNNKYKVVENHIVVNKLDNKDQFKKIIRTISETAENFLGCRSIVIGGIKRLNILSDEFDQKIVNGKKDPGNEIFLKLAKRVVEKCGGTAADYSAQSVN